MRTERVRILSDLEPLPMASAMCSTGASCRRMSFSCGVGGSSSGSQCPGPVLRAYRLHMPGGATAGNAQGPHTTTVLGQQILHTMLTVATHVVQSADCM